MNLLRSLSGLKSTTSTEDDPPVQKDITPHPSASDLALPAVFPEAFNVYCTKYHRNGNCDIYLGASPESIFLSAVSHNHDLRTSELGTTVFGGADHNFPVVATAGYNSLATSNRSLIKLSSPPAEREVTEFLCMKWHWGSESYQFDLHVPRLELPGRFEWRASRGGGVRKVRKRGWGLKLMLLLEGGGEEMVAVLVTQMVAGTKLGAFRFEGRAKGGGLGNLFAVAVVVTGLRIWQFKFYCGQAF